MRNPADHRSRFEGEDDAQRAHESALASELAQQQQQQKQQQAQQQKTRRRRGSLRKVALLGRGAQRERREAKQLSIEVRHDAAAPGPTSNPSPTAAALPPRGLGISDMTRRAPADGYASRPAAATSPRPPVPPITIPRRSDELTAPLASPAAASYSTTDEEEGGGLHMGGSRPGDHHRSGDGPASSGSESSPLLLPPAPRGLRRRLTNQHQPPRAKSPLALSTPLPSSDGDWDYAETEWWGWVVGIVTWLVFVTGMGSCLGLWSWAWDVGITPYAPPELEDDPTLPIVGYYPALIILTGVMAWVWVVIAWVGMKYFRHAKISGD